MAAQHAVGASWRVGVEQDERTALVGGGPFVLVLGPVLTAMAVSGLTLVTPNAGARRWRSDRQAARTGSTSSQ
ncbi:hypothetical protein ACIA6T_29310 [Streptomyces sp. NPDC051740]|uniref:hypothetical protein n=1 Tax=Streptomyces sp. NPDC051740 TaxID=3365673 RepID=UPI0037A7C03A